MDYQMHKRDPMPESDAQRPMSTRPQPQQKVRRRRSSPALVILMCLVLSGAAGAAGYMWRDMDAKDSDKARQAEITALRAKNTNLEKDLANAKKAATADESTTKSPTQAALDSMEAAVKSGNYAALEGYMASKVNVILAASEGVGMRTPAQAVVDIKYLDSGTDPWNFELPATTIDNYQTGDYEKYFPENALVGKSANDYVVSFQFDDSGKINGIFMTANADLL